MSVAAAPPSSDSPNIVEWLVTMDDSSVAVLRLNFNCTHTASPPPPPCLHWAASHVTSHNFIDSAVKIDAIVRCGLLSQDSLKPVALSSLHTPAKVAASKM